MGKIMGRVLDEEVVKRNISKKWLFMRVTRIDFRDRDECELNGRASSAILELFE